MTKDNNTHTEHHTIPSPREGAEKRACGEPSVTQRQIPADNNEEPSLQGGDAVDMMTSPTGEAAGETAAASGGGGEECDIIEREDRSEAENVQQKTPTAASDNDDNNNSQGKTLIYSHFSQE